MVHRHQEFRLMIVVNKFGSGCRDHFNLLLDNLLTYWIDGKTMLEALVFPHQFLVSCNKIYRFWDSHKKRAKTERTLAVAQALSTTKTTSRCWWKVDTDSKRVGREEARLPEGETSDLTTIILYNF